MRKLHLLALSIGLGFGSIAMAEPAVTMYGILDGGVTVSKLQHQTAKVQMTNGNWLSNRWGLMGRKISAAETVCFSSLSRALISVTVPRPQREKHSTVKQL